MAAPWNLTACEWSDVLLSGSQPQTLANKLMRGTFLPWTDILVDCTRKGDRVLDLGSGKGEHSAILALKGREMTLMDWSAQNLQFSSELFRAMNLQGTFSQGDITKPLPFKDGSFDVAFSCGVFEYFSEDQIQKILREMSRISSRKIVIMVPNALSLPYRIGKWYLERKKRWPWGGEVPSYSLKRQFASAGAYKIHEFSVATKHSLDFLKMPWGRKVGALCSRVLRLNDSSKPSFLRQGYILVTIGEKYHG